MFLIPSLEISKLGKLGWFYFRRGLKVEIQLYRESQKYESLTSCNMGSPCSCRTINLSSVVSIRIFNALKPKLDMLCTCSTICYIHVHWGFYLNGDVTRITCGLNPIEYCTLIIPKPTLAPFSGQTSNLIFLSTCLVQPFQVKLKKHLIYSSIVL